MKKCKRSLSIVLALVMICSTLSIMSFAAENMDGAVYEFHDASKTISLQTTSDMGNTYYTNCTILVDGSWHPGDGSFCWTNYNCSLSGLLSEHFSWEYEPNSVNTYTLVLNIYYTENYDDSELVYTIKVIFDEDNTLSVKVFTPTGTLYASTTIRISLEEA